MTVNLFMQQANIKSLGPYLRYGVWFYGCDKHCDGCIYRKQEILNYETVSVDSVFQNILSYKDIEGVTISGGEPFLQHKALLYLVKKLYEKGLGIILYTGKTMSEIISNKEYIEVLKYIDLLIDGEYIKELDQNNNLLGSTNQVPYFLTNRYLDYSSLYGIAGHRKSEVTIENNELHSVGIPTKEEKIIVEAILGERIKNGR